MFLSASLPTGIMLEPQIGLVMNDFAAGVEFFKTLPSIDDPFELRGPDFAAAVEPVTADDWLSTVKQQVVDAVRRDQGEPGNERLEPPRSPSPMTITASAKVYSLYTSKQVFNGQVIGRRSRPTARS